ncbi:MAG: hypothetical protein QG608_1231 [Actinomycetota bacterium]|nr:hypothetical protein [Actinomycetota bacterium]
MDTDALGTSAFAHPAFAHPAFAHPAFAHPALPVAPRRARSLRSVLPRLVGGRSVKPPARTFESRTKKEKEAQLG